MRRNVVTILVGSALVAGSLVLAASPASAARSCFGKPATIVGTNTNPNRPADIIGTPGNDVIVGLGGWDEIDAGRGHDLICAGGGDDFINAGPGNDKVRAQGGQDTVNAVGGDDRVWGGTNSDSLVGGAGNDRLRGGGGTADSLVGGAGRDYMHGGRGYDTAEFWDSPRGVTADLRSDTASGFGADQIVKIEGLIGSSHNDVLYGDEHANMIRGGSGDDEIHSFGSSIDGGTDLLRSDGGTDLLDAGDGPDMVSYNLSPFPVDANLVTGEAVSADGFGHDMLVGVENLTGSKYDDSLTGDDKNNGIVGNGGDDVMDGGGGSDEAAFFDSRVEVTVDLMNGTATAPGWGSDTLVNFEHVSGSAYRDLLIGDDGPNMIWGGSRADTLQGLGGDDRLIGETGLDSAEGGDGTDECDAEKTVECEIDLSQPAMRFASANPWRMTAWGAW